MEIKKNKTRDLLVILTIVKSCLIIWALLFGKDVLIPMLVVWGGSLLLSEIHLWQFCKSGSLVRFGGTLDHIDPKNEHEIEQSYNLHILTAISCVLFMSFGVVKIYFL